MEGYILETVQDRR